MGLCWRYNPLNSPIPNMILLQAAANPQVINIIFIFGLLIVFYFFMIRPQQKKQKDQKNFMESLKKGDYVVTIGGIHGKILNIESTTVILEVDKGMKLRFEKGSLSHENTIAARKLSENTQSND